MFNAHAHETAVWQNKVILIPIMFMAAMWQMLLSWQKPFAYFIE